MPCQFPKGPHMPQEQSLSQAVCQQMDSACSTVREKVLDSKNTSLSAATLGTTSGWPWEREYLKRRISDSEPGQQTYVTMHNTTLSAQVGSA